MVNEIAGKEKNRTTQENEKSLCQKANKVFQSYLNQQENQTSLARSLVHSLTRSLTFSSSSLLTSIKDSYYMVLFSSNRDYFSLFFGAHFISSSLFFSLFLLRNLFNIRFITLEIVVSPSNLFSLFCVNQREAKSNESLPPKLGTL